MILITEIKVISEVLEDEKEKLINNLNDESYMQALKASIAYELMQEDGRDETIEFNFKLEGE